jgi:hypothetical protein
MAKVAAYALILLLAGCATNYGAGGLCALGPIRPQAEDKFTRKTAERIVLENETGEQVCGWKP